MPELTPNPWESFPTRPPYVLDTDEAIVRDHNARRPDKYRFRLDLLPEPFMGPVDAPVVLLNLNPGFVEQDRLDYSPPQRHAMIRRSLHHELPASEAFFFLTDEFHDTGGGRWWRRRLGPLIRKIGLEKVRLGIQVIEYVPYKSQNFYDLPELLPSQHYSISLVQRAIERDAVIVVMRKYDAWKRVVPQLEEADAHRLSSWQNVTVGPGNTPTGYAKILKRLS